MQYLNFIFLLIKIIVLSSINFSVQAQNKYDGIYKDSNYGNSLTCLISLGDRVIIKDNKALVGSSFDNKYLSVLENEVRNDKIIVPSSNGLVEGKIVQEKIYFDFNAGRGGNTKCKVEYAKSKYQIPELTSVTRIFCKRNDGSNIITKLFELEGKCSGKWDVEVNKIDFCNYYRKRFNDNQNIKMYDKEKRICNNNNLNEKILIETNNEMLEIETPKENSLSPISKPAF